MKQISVTIPDNKETLFIEFMKKLSFVKGIEKLDNMDIPELHKNIIDQRTKNYMDHAESYRDWEDLQKEINLKYGL